MFIFIICVDWTGARRQEISSILLDMKQEKEELVWKYFPFLWTWRENFYRNKRSKLILTNNNVALELKEDKRIWNGKIINGIFNDSLSFLLNSLSCYSLKSIPNGIKLCFIFSFFESSSSSLKTDVVFRLQKNKRYFQF